MFRAGGRWLAVTVCLASVASVARAQGSAPAATHAVSGSSAGPPLVWQAPEGCPGRDDVLGQVSALSRQGDVDWSRFEQIRARIAGSAGRWSLQLEFIGNSGARRRELSSGRCDELAEAAAVAIVLAHRSDGALVPEPALEPAAPDPVPRAVATDNDASEAAAASEAATADAAASPPSLEPSGEPLVPVLGAEALLDPSTLGSVALGAGLGLELHGSKWSAALYGAAFARTETALGANQAVGLQLWTGGARGCLRWGRALDTCAHFELGRLAAEGVGLRQPRQERELWAAPGLSAAFTSSPFDGFGVTTRLALFHPLVRGRYRVDETDVVHEIPTFTVRLALGVAVPLL